MNTKNKKNSGDAPEKPSLFQRLYDKGLNAFNYFWTGVWKDPGSSLKIRTIKTLNLTIRSFMDRGLQDKSMSLTYSTVLAIVPALALLFAISRGFGFQNLVQKELYVYFPAQQKAITTALSFVDSYLKQSSQGIFVGIGIIMLLWTLISLLSNIETAFNRIWGIKKDRSLPQKITDYIAICLMIPILMICSSGASIFMSTIVQDNIKLPFLTPVFNGLLECAPLVLAWLAFSLSFCLIPNTKVSFKYASIAGALSAIAFQILQLLFVNGQIYVTKYNAIYGSFAFLPLMLIWLQLSWLILMSGCVFTYSMQNVFSYNYLGDVGTVSQTYRREVAIVITALVFRRFIRGKAPYSMYELSKYYDLPMRLVNHCIGNLRQAGIVFTVSDEKEHLGVAPAVEVGKLTLGELMRRLDAVGNSDFIPGFSEMYAPLLGRYRKIMADSYAVAQTTLIKDLPLPDAINTEK